MFNGFSTVVCDDKTFSLRLEVNRHVFGSHPRRWVEEREVMCFRTFSLRLQNVARAASDDVACQLTDLAELLTSLIVHGRNGRAGKNIMKLIEEEFLPGSLQWSAWVTS